MVSVCNRKRNESHRAYPLFFIYPGTTTDFNLLFGTDSYLPRMATLNFTSELFGQSVNFWEISARAEGFEEMVSTVFGPKGPLNREFFRKKFSFLNRLIGNESAEEDGKEYFFDFANLFLSFKTFFLLNFRYVRKPFESGQFAP